MELAKLSVSRLHNLDLGQFIIRYLTDFNNLGLDPAQDLDFKTLHDSILAQSPTFNLALAQIAAQEESQLLAAQDIDRDRKVRTIRKAVSVYRFTDNATEKTAYNKLKIVLNNYKGIEAENFEAESLGLDNLIAELRNANNLSASQTLGLVAHIDNLEIANNTFKTTFSTRSSASITTVVYDTKTLRKNILATYKDLAEYVLVMAKRRNTPYYTSILTAINTGRSYYNNIVAHRVGVGKAKPVV